jgi:hypothetical protein
MKTMSYTLYIADGCQSCASVAAMLLKSQIHFRKINLSDASTERPEGVLVVPSLYKNGALLAYGPDILSVLDGE